jgi:polyisoprenoid-binding protein YceI
MILIPVGLIVVFLAVTRGDKAHDTTLTPQGTIVGTDTPPLDVLAGRWQIEPGADSWVGYSVHEEILSAETPNVAEGRTLEVDGGIVLDASGVKAAAINADMQQLKSDDPKRDESMRTEGLETDRFPKSSFLLTQPIVLSQTPPLGQHVDVKATGDLTLHGVTKSVEATLQVQLLNGSPILIEVVGTIPITFADFGIVPPDVAGTLKVEDHGEVQIHLHLARIPDEVAGNPPPTSTGTEAPHPNPPGTNPA